MNVKQKIADSEVFVDSKRVFVECPETFKEPMHFSGQVLPHCDRPDRHSRSACHHVCLNSQ